MLRDTKHGDIWTDLDSCALIHTGASGSGPVYKDSRGRWVGSDGFVVPENVHEFFERYPDYVRAYTFKCMHRVRGIRYDLDTFEDVASEMSLHITNLSEGRKDYKNGARDYVQCFDPVRQYGAKKGQFFHFINMVIATKFSGYVYGKGVAKEPALQGFSLCWCDPGDDESSQESYLVAKVTAPMDAPEELLIGTLHAEKIIEKAKEKLGEDADLVERTLLALLVHDSKHEAADAVGVTKATVDKLLKRIGKALGDEFGYSGA